MKLYLVNRIDSRGTLPVKCFMLKENAKFFIGECNIALKLISQSDNPEKEFDLLKQFDTNVIFCDSIKYVLEEIFAT